MKKGYIYKIISPSGKIYIGQTINIIQRKSVYKTLKCEKQLKLYRSLSKYGWDQHKFEILEEIEYNKLHLDYLERFYIRTYDCVDNGLNCMEGGCIRLSDESIRKMSKSNTGKKYPNRKSPPKGLKRKPISDETKKKIGDSIRGNKYPNRKKPDKMSQETRDKISKTLKGRIPWNKGKKLYEQLK